MNLTIRPNTYPFIPYGYCFIECSELLNIKNEEDLLEYSSQIEKYYRSNNCSGIVINFISEGLPFVYLNTIQKLAKFLVRINLVNYKNILLVSGAVPVSENVKNYINICNKFNWDILPISFVNWWEITRRSNQNSQKDLYDQIDTSPKVKNKKFVFYNNSVKMHRLFLTTEIIKYGLLDKSYTSNYYDPSKDAFMLGHCHELLPTLHLSVKNILNENDHIFPLNLGFLGKTEDKKSVMSHGLTADDLMHYNDTYFAIITESKFFKDTDLNLRSELSLNCHLISEKTYKFMHGKKPFVLAGSAGSLDILRKTGYKTFHPFIDETYDTVEDDEMRLIAISKEISRLCSFTDDEWLEWQKNINPIVIHNHKTLLEMGESVLMYTPNYLG